MSLPLEGKIAVVTGAGTGIGLAIAERFAREGAQVVLVGRRKEKLDEAAARMGNGAYGVSVDVGDEAQVRDLFASLDRVDILCTCAGKAVFGAMDELPPSAVRDLFSGRFFGQVYACHYAIPKMSEGSVILLCSGIADRAHVPEYSGGSALCGAVNAMGRNLAVELGPRGIRVNVLSPGFIGSTEIDFNLEGEKAIAFVKRSIASTPLGRPGTPDAMADAALFLATCDFASGQVIEVDGGWTAS
ncbi:MAG: SDR family oxidoreductase [Deltaproteobacteria bacterium]|nr:SDR family oxidoreductase [Deltaproteobacteria bacterium]MBW2445808.1 SDR family oxidoreductase [Deltaproteobacteria bacterium]